MNGVPYGEYTVNWKLEELKKSMDAAIQTSMASIHADTSAEPHARNGGGAFQTAST